MRHRVLPLLALALCLVAAAPAPAVAAIAVRGGDHDRFSRIVFDFERPPAYEARIEGGRLFIRFQGSHEFDFGALSREALARIADPDRASDGATTTVSFAVKAGLLRHFTSDGKLVVDIADPAPPASTATPSSPAAASPPAPAADTQAPKPSAEAPAAVDAAGDTIRVEADVDGADLVLAFRWNRPTPAAIFARAGYLWAVFEGVAAVDDRDLDLAPDSFAGDRLRSKDVETTPHHTILRYRLRDDLHIAARRDGTDWRVRLTARDTLPRLSVEAVEQPGPSGARLLVRGGEVGAALRIRDAAVGDEIDIVPFGESGHGNASTRSYVQFALLPSAQGLVVERRDDDLLVTRGKGGVVVSAANGLILSRSQLEESGDRASGAATLIDLAAWRHGGREDFARVEHDLLARLARSSPSERRAARWALARFYLAHGAAADALGPLELMREVDPDLERMAPWRAVHAVTLLELGRGKEALAELRDPSLDAAPEMWLWRGLAAEAEGRTAEAVDDFEQGEKALADAPPDLAIRARFALARAALAEGRLDIAGRVIAALQDAPLRPEKGLAVDYLYGRLAEARGDLGTARARFEDAAGALDRALSAHARFDLVKLELRENNISPDEAIAMLERLRFAWRGDMFEQQVLDLLARLYVAQGKYREGLETYRQAAIIAADSPRGREVARAMSEIFTQLYLEGGADKMSPLAALALFYDFRELTPLGAEGDRMIRHLVDRLVAVDLLDRAAELLEHQVSYRLEGTAQAVVAVRLAKIYLLASKAEKALEILRATRQAGLPRDVLRDRRLVEARALIEIKRFEEALVRLEDEQSPEGDLLRADAYWERQDWARLVDTSERLLGSRWQRPEALQEGERQHLIREAIALSFLDRRADLARLRARYRPLMTGGDLAGIFDMLTGDDPPPAGEVSRIAGELSQSARFRSFLAAYKAEFTNTSDTSAGATASAS